MIEESGKVRLGQAFKDYFKGYVEFLGRSTRAGYWWMQLILGVVSLVLFGWFFGVIIFTFDRPGQASGIWQMVVVLVLLVILALGTFLPSLALRVRRLRDAGLRGRGAAVLIGIQAAVGATLGFAQYSQALNMMSHMRANFGPTIPNLGGGGLLLIFITYAISLFLFVVTLLPSDTMLTTSHHSFWRFFLRVKADA